MATLLLYSNAIALCNQCFFVAVRETRAIPQSAARHINLARDVDE